MHHSPLSTRRKAPTKTLFARLFENQKIRKQRAEASAHQGTMEYEGRNLSRSLVIIFAIHIVAICMIFIHYKFFSNDALPISPNKTSTAQKSKAEELLILSNGDRLYRAVEGDTYSIIANRYAVSEEALVLANENAEIRTGKTLLIPDAPVTRVAASTETANIVLEQPNIDASEEGLVDLLASTEAPTAKIILPQNQAPSSTTQEIAQTHTVQNGENIWRISNKYKVSQEALMEMNQITDPTKLKIGQILKIPEP